MMTTDRQAWSPRWANGTRGRETSRMIKAQVRDTSSDLGLHMGAGDGNRTRTISLGMSSGLALTWPSSGRWSYLLTVSTRGARPVTGPSGTQRARSLLDASYR
jgi:hypothetical protein